jgi:hypothetical protein
VEDEGVVAPTEVRTREVLWKEMCGDMLEAVEDGDIPPYLHTSFEWGRSGGRGQ